MTTMLERTRLLLRTQDTLPIAVENLLVDQATTIDLMGERLTRLEVEKALFVQAFDLLKLTYDRDKRLAPPVARPQFGQNVDTVIG